MTHGTTIADGRPPGTSFPILWLDRSNMAIPKESAAEVMKMERHHGHAVHCKRCVMRDWKLQGVQGVQAALVPYSVLFQRV